MKSVNVSVKSEEKASRMELLIRLVYWIPLVIVYFVLYFVTAILWVINLFTILIFGKRMFADVMQKFWQYIAKFYAYYLLLTDERPPILPE